MEGCLVMVRVYSRIPQSHFAWQQWEDFLRIFCAGVLCIGFRFGSFVALQAWKI